MSFFARRTAFRVAVELTGAGHHPGAADLVAPGPDDESEQWVDLGPAPARALEPVRIRAADLGAAQRITAGLKRSGSDDVEVLLDVPVMIAEDAVAARAALARLDARLDRPWVAPSVSYVGSSAGLAGLLADIAAVGVADGVTLQPMLVPDVLGHIAFETVRILESCGLRLSAPPVRHLREIGAHRCAGPSPRRHESLSA